MFIGYKQNNATIIHAIHVEIHNVLIYNALNQTMTPFGSAFQATAHLYNINDQCM